MSKCLKCLVQVDIPKGWKHTTNEWLDELEKHAFDSKWKETLLPEATPCSRCERAYCSNCVDDLLWCDLGGHKKKVWLCKDCKNVKSKGNVLLRCECGLTFHSLKIARRSRMTEQGRKPCPILRYQDNQDKPAKLIEPIGLTSRDKGTPTWCYALVLVHHENKYLAVKETEGRGYWLCGGFVEENETIVEAAKREVKEEAGVDCELEGILKVEHSTTKGKGKLRVIFSATCKDTKDKVKDFKDKESDGAEWLSLDEIRQKALLPLPEGLRGSELLIYAEHLHNRKPVYPLSLLQ